MDRRLGDDPYGHRYAQRMGTRGFTRDGPAVPIRSNPASRPPPPPPPAPRRRSTRWVGDSAPAAHCPGRGRWPRRPVPTPVRRARANPADVGSHAAGGPPTTVSTGRPTTARPPAGWRKGPAAAGPGGRARRDALAVGRVRVPGTSEGTTPRDSSRPARQDRRDR